MGGVYGPLAAPAAAPGPLAAPAAAPGRGVGGGDWRGIICAGQQRCGCPRCPATGKGGRCGAARGRRRGAPVRPERSRAGGLAAAAPAIGRYGVHPDAVRRVVVVATRTPCPLRRLAHVAPTLRCVDSNRGERAAVSLASIVNRETAGRAGCTDMRAGGARAAARRRRT